MRLAIGDVANHVEGIELQPFGKITLSVPGYHEVLSLVEESLCNLIDKRFILNERGHGEGAVDRPPQLSMKLLVGRGE